MCQVRCLPDKLLSNGCVRKLIGRHTQVSLSRIRRASQMAAVAKKEGIAESNLHSKYEISRKYLVMVLALTSYSESLALLTLHKEWMGLG